MIQWNEMGWDEWDDGNNEAAESDIIRWPWDISEKTCGTVKSYHICFKIHKYLHVEQEQAGQVEFTIFLLKKSPLTVESLTVYQVRSIVLHHNNYQSPDHK